MFTFLTRRSEVRVRAMRATALSASVMATAVLLAGCVSPGAGAGASSDPAPEPTQWQTILAGVGDDGSVSLETALQAFSAAITPLPGAELPEGRIAPVMSGTLAVEWAQWHWSEFTPDQQQVAATAVPGLEAPIDGAAGDVAAPGSIQVPQSAIDEIFAFYLDRSGIADPGWRPDAQFSTVEAVAYVKSEDSACHIFLTEQYRRFGAAEQRFSLAHEVFHCVANLASGNFAKVPWLDEGLAMWAASNVPVGDAGLPASKFYYDEDSVDFWFSYLSYPGKSMYARSYDAFGFYWYLQNHGVDLWPIWKSAIGADNDTAFSLLTGGDSVLVDWASGNFRDETLGAAWDMSGPGIPGIVGSIKTDVKQPVANGSRARLDSVVASVDVALVDPKADIVTITATGVGHIRLGDGSEVSVPSTGVEFCGRADRCACPEGLERAPGLGDLPPGLIRAAITGGTSKATASIEGRAFDPTSDCVKPSATAGQWALRSLVMAADDGSVTVTDTVTRNAPSLSVRPDGTAAIDMRDAGIHVSMSGEFPVDIDSTVNGHAGSRIAFDEASASLSWVTDGSDTGFVVTTEGADVGSNQLPADGFDLPATMSYHSDGHVMTWTFASDGATSTWTWVRR